MSWAKRFVEFHRLRHPEEMGEAEVEQYLTSLAVQARVSAATQNQAAAALMFLYRKVLGRDFERPIQIIRGKSGRSLPVVLTGAEVRAVCSKLDGVYRLVARLLYGSGLRLLECLTLRVKDIDLVRLEIRLRRGKGERDRVTMFPQLLIVDLQAHLGRVRERYRRDLAAGCGGVSLPGALAAKLPGASRDWVWQFVFPASRLYRDRRTGERRRHHLHESAVLQALICDPSPGVGARHSYGAGATGPPRCSDHDDLYPRIEPRAGECKESSGHTRGFIGVWLGDPFETLCRAKAH